MSPIEIIGERTPDAAILSIRDHGPGLELGTGRSVLDTFARGRGSDRHGGSGPGLAIAKGFADAMGIAITASDAKGRGARFQLTFAS